MNRIELAKSELRRWAEITGTGLSIHYYGGRHPAIVNNIPHRYQCEVGDHKSAYYRGSGVTEEQAVLACYEAWQK